jgi:peptidoglycan/LPS O-acetylase OafA/YrhL
MKKYITSIDGLRAFAVLAVILFHAFPTYFPGGFVGVDVFFVISGFVITTKISEETKAGKFSIAEFYCDRIKRLVPLFALVAYSTSLLAIFFLTPRELIGFAESLISAATFVSNIYYWRSLDYFEAGQTNNLLLHTWSLSVEWQFYFVFPIVFGVLYRFGRRSLLLLMLATVVLSTAFSEILIAKHSNFSFYMLPTRMFELLVGAMIAITHNSKTEFKFSKIGGNIPSSAALWIGLCGLAFQVKHNTLGSPFPGLNALWVVLLSSFVLIGLLSNNAYGEKIFTLPPLKHLGFISYGLYLWHYPMLELASQIYADRLGMVSFWVAFAITLLVVAEWSGRLVERPIWRRKTSFKLTLILIGFGLLPTIPFYLLVQDTSGFREDFITRLDKQKLDNFSAIERFATPNHLKNPVTGRCSELNDFSEEFSKIILDCASVRPTILVFGDSHAINLYNGLARSSALNSQYNIFAIASGGCALGNSYRNCDINEVMNFVTRNSSRFFRILYVEAGFRQFLTVHEQQSERRDFITDASILSLRPDTEKLGRIADGLANLKAGDKLLWIGPWPEPHLYLNGIVAVRNLTEMDNSKTFKEFEKLSLFATHIAKHHKEKLHYINLQPLFADSGSGVYIDGCLRFSDKDHLSICGEDFLAKVVISKFNDI